MDVGSHQNTIVCSNAKECDKAYPNGNTEVDLSHTKEGSHIHSRDIEVKKPVLSVEPNQDKAARKGYKNTREVYH